MQMMEDVEEKEVDSEFLPDRVRTKFFLKCSLCSDLTVIVERNRL